MEIAALIAVPVLLIVALVARVAMRDRRRTKDATARSTFDHGAVGTAHNRLGANVPGRRR